MSLLLVTTAGCYSGSKNGYGLAGGGGSGGGGSGGGGSGGGGALAGLPCDVSDLLQNRCLQCHNGRAMSASSLPLTSYDDLVSPSPRNGSETVAALALSRMQSADRPMPPSAPLPASELQVFASWVAADLPPGDCGSSGGGGGGVVDNSQYDTALVCTSGRYWGSGGGGGGGEGGDDERDDEGEGSWNMSPGRACISCHSQSEGPRFDIAGTVYPTAHEPNNCAGTGSGLTIVITDARGQQFRLTPNSVGNFGDGSMGLTKPYTAVVQSNGGERAMVTPQTNGDCNSCHSANGTDGAPGRIMIP